MGKRISEEVRLRIKGYLEGFIDGQLKAFQVGTIKPENLRPQRVKDTQGRLKPFHEAILPHGVLLTSEFERSFSTSLGSSFEEAAYQIARDKYREVERSKRIEGVIPNGAIRVIDTLKTRINSQSIRFDVALSQVLESKTKSTQVQHIITDFYYVNGKGCEFHFEMKTAKPNKGQCIDYNEHALKLHVLRKSAKEIRTFFAFAYNPYGMKRDEYRHSYPLRYSDFEQSILIGKEFWDLVGGNGTYIELLEIYREVGKELGPEIVKKLLSRS